MRILTYADLHLEFGDWTPPQVECDVLVVAGDLHIKGRGVDWLLKHFPHVPVVKVGGNHEAYKSALPYMNDKLRTLTQGTNIHFLENDAVEIDGVVFLGCTLWTDFRLFELQGLYLRAEAMADAGEEMNDYRRIRHNPSYRPLKPLDTLKIHEQSLTWLKQQFEKYRGRQIVVVTHHAPSRRSVPETYDQSILSAAYASNLDDLVRESGARLWVHGHNHAFSHYEIGRTEIVCNAKGYPGERTGWNPEMVVEIP